VPSDFQDYSLVTLVGVAAHLMHVSDLLSDLSNSQQAVSRGKGQGRRCGLRTEQA
jgi:hypothetical protein